MRTCIVCGQSLPDEEYQTYGRHEDHWVETQPAGFDPESSLIGTARDLGELLGAAGMMEPAA